MGFDLNSLILFVAGIGIAFVLQLVQIKFFPKWSAQFAEFIVSRLVKVLGVKGQNDISNYMGLFFLKSGLNLISKLPDEEIVNNYVSVLGATIDDLQNAMVKKEYILQKDTKYLNEVSSTNTPDSTDF